jgi:Ca2+-binding RTX toxin-like protein
VTRAGKEFIMFGRLIRSFRGKAVVRGAVGPRARRALSRAAGTVCEYLETRIQLADIGPDDGLTDGYDHVSIFKLDGNSTGILISPNAQPKYLIHISSGEPITLRLGGGNDIVEIGLNISNFYIYGEGGDDLIDARYQVYPTIFWGGDGNDEYWGGEQDTTVYGEAGNDTVAGGNGTERFEGGDGDDSLDGDMGNDTILGGPGNDTLRGGAGNDSIEGGDGNDYIVGGNGDDSLYGLGGNDTLVGTDNDGNDIMHGGGGTADRLEYGAKTVPLSITLEHADEPLDYDQDGAYVDDIRSNIEIVVAGSGNDVIIASQTYGYGVTLRGGGGNDTLRGGAQGDSLLGEDGDDLLDGNGGNDTLRGGAGYDSMYGGLGDDLLDGRNADNDLFNGNSGTDTVLADLLPLDEETNLFNVETVSRA